MFIARHHPTHPRSVRSGMQTEVPRHMALLRSAGLLKTCGYKHLAPPEQGVSQSGLSCKARLGG
jgi:hypothetical protein